MYRLPFSERMYRIPYSELYVKITLLKDVKITLLEDVKITLPAARLKILNLTLEENGVCGKYFLFFF